MSYHGNFQYWLLYGSGGEHTFSGLWQIVLAIVVLTVTAVIATLVVRSNW
jgi:hypothetical protein